MRTLSLIAVAIFTCTGPALACPQQPAAISGEFAVGEKGWGEPDGEFVLKGPEAVFTPQVGTQTARWNAGVALADTDVCVTVTMPPTTADAARSYGGLLFWVVDKDNFHQAVISPNGMFTVARKVQGRISPAAPVGWMQTDALKLGPGEKNLLRARLEGQNVVIEINGREVARFRGQAPQAPGHVGLVAASAPAAVDTWQMSEFSAAEIASAPAAAPSPEAPAGAASGEAAAPPAASADVTGALPAADANCGTGKVLFEDDFKSHDPMWGGKASDVVIGDGQAEFDPAPGTPTLRWNRAFVFGDIDACASVRLAKPTGDPTKSYAGLIFWAEDSRNYHQAVIAPNGYFTVARIVDGKAVAKRPVPWTKIGVVKTGAKEENILRVTARGDKVDIAINGKAVANFTGEPPRWPSHIGMLASSAESKKGDTWTISGLKVTAPQ